MIFDQQKFLGEKFADPTLLINIWSYQLFVLKCTTRFPFIYTCYMCSISFVTAAKKAKQKLSNASYIYALSKIVCTKKSLFVPTVVEYHNLTQLRQTAAAPFFIKKKGLRSIISVYFIKKCYTPKGKKSSEEPPKIVHVGNKKNRHNFQYSIIKRGKKYTFSHWVNKRRDCPTHFLKTMVFFSLKKPLSFSTHRLVHRPTNFPQLKCKVMVGMT